MGQTASKPIRLGASGKVNKVNDTYPGGSADYASQAIPTGNVIKKGMLGIVIAFIATTIARYWDTTLSASPATDIKTRYVEMASDAPVTPARGVLCFWKNKATRTVTTNDAADFEFAGVCLSAYPEKGKFGCIGVAGNLPMKFLSSTTKTTPAIGDMAVSTSGNSGLADVLADATAQTFGTYNTNEVVGRLRSAVSSQIATVELRPGLDIE